MLRFGVARRGCAGCARGLPASAPARRRGVMGASITAALDHLDDLTERCPAIECGTLAVLRTLSKSDRPGGDPRRDRVDEMSGLSRARLRPVLGTRGRLVSGLRRFAGRRRRRRRSPERHGAQPKASDSPHADRRRGRRIRRVDRRVRVHRRKRVPAGGGGRRGTRNAGEHHDVVPRPVTFAFVVGRSGRSAWRVAGGRIVDPGRPVSRPQRCPRLPIRCRRGNAAGDTHADAAADARADPAANAAADAQADAEADGDSRSNALFPGCA